MASFRPEYGDMKELVADADAALYHAKQNGKNQTAFLSGGRCRSLLLKNGHTAAGAKPSGDAAPSAGDGTDTKRRKKKTGTSSKK